VKVSLTLKRKPRRMEVEAASLIIPSRPWIKDLYATPFLSEYGNVTDLWIATESSTGAHVFTNPCKTIEGLTIAVAQWARYNNITERRWKEILTRTRRAIGAGPKV